MKGVKVVEVAQFTFTPAAGVVLADWGAEVIKVENAVHGDAQRSLRIGAGGAAAGSFQPLMEHPNRGKRSIGLALGVASGHAVLMELVRGADVFLTNFLPDGRRRLRIAGKPYAYWVEHLQTMEGPWAPVQNPLETAADPQMDANGYLIPVVDADGKPRRLVASPVQFDETPPSLIRAPQFAEHTDEILRELGKDDEEIVQLKIDGACT